jgi:hypothetical protein
VFSVSHFSLVVHAQSCLRFCIVQIVVTVRSANIKFCFKTSKTAPETFQLIKQAYCDRAVSCTRDCEWYARFRDGCDNLEDDELSEQPRAVRRPGMIKKFLELIWTYRRMTLRMMEEELKIIRETFLKILLEYLGNGRSALCLFGRWAEGSQTATLSRLQSVDHDRSLLDSIVTGDETWCFQYDPQTKRQSLEWR